LNEELDMAKTPAPLPAPNPTNLPGKPLEPWMPGRWTTLK
jgi:hypothetical protein